MKLIKSLFLSLIVVVSLSQLVLAQSASTDEQVADAIGTVQKVELHGDGHAAATKAMAVLNRVSASQIPMLFDALDESNQISANWLRAAIQKSLANTAELPTDSIREYFDDHSNSAKGRWLAWQILAKEMPDFRAATIDQLATDPSMPLREIGIEKLLADASTFGTDIDEMDDKAKEEKKALLQLALENARDVDQITSISKSLAPLGQEINLRKHLGFLETWHLVSGFDNKEESGFDVAYEPEKQLGSVDLAGTFTVGEETAAWKESTTEDETGVVDLNEVIAKDKGVIAYASSTYESETDCEAEVRIGTPNAHKIWINGELVMSNEIYHNSNSIDKFSSTVKLKKGSNQIVVKLCQNEQTEPWAQDWSFQLRFCDSTGKAL